MWEYRRGHVIDILKAMPSESIQCVVTSPPYWGLRAYAGEQDVVWGGRLNPDGSPCQHEWGEERRVSAGRNDQDRNTRNEDGRNPDTQNLIGCPKQTASTGAFCRLCGAWKGAYGNEPIPELYVEHSVQILREIRRVLRNDGVVFWNIGDSYAGGGGITGVPEDWKSISTSHREKHPEGRADPKRDAKAIGLKPKDLTLIPFRVALAVQADGWWVRSDIIWSKPNPMPESVRDRPTRSHEYIFMLTKNKTYYYDQDAIRDAPKPEYAGHAIGVAPEREGSLRNDGGRSFKLDGLKGRNACSVWEITTQSYREAHFATFPEELPRRCIMAATSQKGQCPKCGEPWVRTTIRGEKIITGGPHVKDTPNIRDKTEAGYYPTITTGWQPTCTCYEIEGYGRWDTVEIPPRQEGDEVEIQFVWRPIRPIGEHPVKAPVVLDPFAGSGTTLQVARLLGRDAIGIDICEKYEEIGVKRAMLDTPDILSFGGTADG